MHSIGFLIDRWDPARGGAERAMAALAGHLEGRGHEVLAFGLRAAEGAPGRFVAVAARGVTRAARERSLAEALPAAARRAGCQVTVGARHLSEVDLYWPHGGSHAAALEARRRALGRRPGTTPRGRHRVFLELERGLLSEGRARRVVCVSPLVHGELAAAHPACRERLVVIENGVDLERFRPAARPAARAAIERELGIDAGTPLIAFAARSPELKGLPALLAALAGLRLHPWHLLIAGPRRPRRWERRARSAGIEPGRVTVRAHVEAERLWPAADLCALPTWRDPSPLVVLEALACGTPVITTRLAGNAGAIDGPQAGSVLEDPADVEALARELSRWIERIRTGAPERDLVRAGVLERDSARWLRRLEAEVEALAP